MNVIMVVEATGHQPHTLISEINALYQPSSSSHSQPSFTSLLHLTHALLFFRLPGFLLFLFLSLSPFYFSFLKLLTQFVCSLMCLTCAFIVFISLSCSSLLFLISRPIFLTGYIFFRSRVAQFCLRRSVDCKILCAVNRLVRHALEENVLGLWKEATNQEW